MEAITPCTPSAGDTSEIGTEKCGFKALPTTSSVPVDDVWVEDV